MSSAKVKRQARKARRTKKDATLNLVSLMDIFTIMVFFLMMNQSDVEVMNNDDITLPDSVTQAQPLNTVNLMVSGSDIIVQGRLVASVKDVLAMPLDQELIPELQKELTYLASKTQASATELELGRPITIMGDKGIPYKVLKRIMATCQKAKYTQISLAAQKKEVKEA
ncbi:RNA polymerase subunit sigma-70 [Bermanella sp. 47_1433_sub80_T6]|nr:RNA polymerase subunit sigma-70 [Bermanella sp. 47_1433_sub80_T6]